MIKSKRRSQIKKISNFVKMKTEFKLNKLKWETMYKQIKERTFRFLISNFV